MANKVANSFYYENYWLTAWLTKNKNLYIQPKMEQKCQAHNLKVVGSNPTPATKYSIKISQMFFSNVFFTTPHNFMWNHAFVINIIQFIQF